MSNEKWKEDYTEICDFRPAKCPYVNIGCENCHSVNMEVRNHMLMDIAYHSRFLIEFIDNLRMEIKTMKEDKIVLENNVGDLKKCIKYLQLKYENNDEEIKRKLKEIEDKSNGEQNVGDLKKCIKYLQLKYENNDEEIKRKLKEIEDKSNGEQKMNNDLKLKCESDNKEMRQKLKQIENKLVEEDKNVIELRREMKRMNDEKESMKQDVAENKQSINISKLKCDRESREIQEKIKKIENKSDEQEKLMNNSKLKCINESREIKEKIKKIENKSDEHEKSINNSKLKCDRDSRKINEKIKEIENKSNEQKREMMIKFNEINEKMVDLKSISKESDKTISALQNRMTILKKKQEQQPFGELIWYIENWKENTEQTRASVNKVIYSDVFYSHKNGYKMCLSLWPDGMISCKGTHLSIACNVVPGEDDQTLMWPFKHDVTFELINQHTNQVHMTCTLRYNGQHILDKGEIDLFNSPHVNASGTSMKYTARRGTDEILIDKNLKKIISTKLNCISAMKEYESKSLEELRHEDYLVNRLYRQQSFLFDSEDVQTVLGLCDSQKSMFESMNYYNKYNRKVEINESINCICRNLKFISLEELSNNSLIDNDQILIRCRVSFKDNFS